MSNVCMNGYVGMSRVCVCGNYGWYIHICLSLLLLLLWMSNDALRFNTAELWLNSFVCVALTDQFVSLKIVNDIYHISSMQRIQIQFTKKRMGSKTVWSNMFVRVSAIFVVVNWANKWRISVNATIDFIFGGIICAFGGISFGCF